MGNEPNAVQVKTSDNLKQLNRNFFPEIDGRKRVCNEVLNSAIKKKKLCKDLSHVDKGTEFYYHD